MIILLKKYRNITIIIRFEKWPNDDVIHLGNRFQNIIHQLNEIDVGSFENKTISLNKHNKYSFIILQKI